MLGNAIESTISTNALAAAVPLGAGLLSLVDSGGCFQDEQCASRQAGRQRYRSDSAAGRRVEYTKVDKPAR